VELLTYTEADLPLTEALEGDPETMRELGGPHTKEAIAKTHERRVEAIASGTWWFKIVPDPAAAPVGTIGIWETSWKGSKIHEIGWMVLPAHQGHGIATRALESILSRARADPRFARIHAFPGAANAPSNALCRKFGFLKTEECEVEYAGRALRCNHWELELGEGG
jgi:RimJ/RimL family protein N-acetyltransferase